MKQITVCLFLLFAAKNIHSQAIRFSSLAPRDALAKAKRENKPLFIDIYTTWCTYCRQMDRDVFTAKETGDFYNAHFINVRYDALQSHGIQIRKNYSLLGFPTFIYLDPDGLVLLKTAGFQPTEKFISNADSALGIQTRKKMAKDSIHISQQ